MATNWDLLVSGEELAEYAKIRAKEFIEETFSNDKETKKEKLESGWKIAKELKKKVRMRKQKRNGDAFEDELWTIFYKMGFKTMNSTNGFALYYDEKLSKQLDIVAIDEETCIFVECKEAERDEKKKSFNYEISEICYKKSKLYQAIREKFPNRKCKYIFATKGYILGDQDKNRLASEKIPYFDDNTVLYYKALTDHLGKAARFQLLGSLFAGEDIKGMDNIVPAIKGCTPDSIPYYTFLIEPEKLLKLGYVLHRTNANNDYEDLLPSYQRLIKKDRLNSVRKFISNKGFFPNSVIISVETNKPMQFDLASGNNSRLYKMGNLHLPKTYQSAYIIDGQHRIYGYSDSEHANNNTIPVVAFENLSKERQLRLFMEINENQKAISPKLRGLLEIDLYYNDADPKKRQSALLGKMAQRLGEDSKSPLFKRIVIGEDSQTQKCCITMEYIKKALEKTAFFNTYKKNGQIDIPGIIDQNNNEKNMTFVYPLIRRYYKYIADHSEEWNNDNSYLPINNTTIGLIRILGDIVGIIVAANPGIKNNADEIYSIIEKSFLPSLVEELDNLSAENRQKIIGARGEGPIQNVPYRIIQMELHERLPNTFTNNDIENYYSEYKTNYNDLARMELNEIRNILSGKIKDFYGTDEKWQNEHMSLEHQKEFTTRYMNKKITMARNDDNSEIDIWRELNLQDIQKIISYGSHWSDDFKEFFSSKGYQKTKSEFLQSFTKLSEQQNNIANGTHITRTNYNIIHEIYSLLTAANNS